MSADQTKLRASLSALQWQSEIGADEAVNNEPIDRFQLTPPEPDKPTAPKNVTAASRRSEPEAERPMSSRDSSADHARRCAAACEDLDALREAIESYDSCPLKAGAINTVFADGNPAARVMIVGEAPGAEEDQQGLPFVGRSGRLLDLALSYAGLSRKSQSPEEAFYITNIVFWRPAGNRTPTVQEAQSLLPFTERHILLAQPDILILLGNVACKSLLRTDTGIVKLRGTWSRWMPSGGGAAIPALPTFHPSFLLRTPRMKRLFWRDLMSLREELDRAERGESDG